jgi:hypothetical protein
VVLSLEPKTGVGTVLYSTPLLWEFAYAREKQRLQGRQALQDAARTQVAIPQRACLKVRLKRKLPVSGCAPGLIGRTA